MRGFRGSRSAQNEIHSRFGKDQNQNITKSEDQRGAERSQFTNRLVLPDWLKTPETKAREAAEAQAPRVAAPVQQQKPVAQKQNHVNSNSAPKWVPQAAANQSAPHTFATPRSPATPRLSVVPAIVSAHKAEPKKVVAKKAAGKKPAAKKASAPRTKKATTKVASAAKRSPKRKAA